MAESDHDDLTEALARLSGGDAAADVPRPAVRPPTPSAPPAAGVARPARPERPAVPTARPMAPPNLTPPDAVAADAAANAVVDDDDAVNIPAPDASVFAPRKPAASAGARAAVARRKQVTFRQTLIPVLLTTGVLAIAFGLARVALGPDSPAAAFPAWATPTFVVAGAVLLALAVLNMLSVRSMLAADAAATPGRA